MRRALNLFAVAIGIATLLLSGTVLAAEVVIRVQDPSQGDWMAGVLGPSIEAFEAQNPHIKVEMDAACNWNDCRDKNIVMVTTGVAPDIIFVYDDNRTGYIRSGMLLDVTPFVERDNPEFLQTLLPPLKEAIQFEGRYWGVPETWLPVIAHTNFNAFNNAGLDDPASIYARGEWNFDTMAQMAQKMTLRNEDGSISQIGVFMHNSFWGMMPWAWGYGADVFNEDATQVNLNTPEARRAFSDLYTLIAEFQVFSSGGRAPTSYVGAIRDGRWGIALWNPVLWHIKYQWQLDEPVDVLPYPVGPVSDRTQGMQVRTWAISSTTKHPEEAWKFLQHLGGIVHDQIYIEQRQSLPLHTVNFRNSLDVHVDHFGSENMALVLDYMAKNSRTLPFAHDRAITNELGNFLMSAWLDQRTVEGALEEGQRVISGMIQSIVAK